MMWIHRRDINDQETKWQVSRIRGKTVNNKKSYPPGEQRIKRRKENVKASNGGEGGTGGSADDGPMDIEPGSIAS